MVRTEMWTGRAENGDLVAEVRAVTVWEVKRPTLASDWAEIAYEIARAVTPRELAAVLPVVDALAASEVSGCVRGPADWWVSRFVAALASRSDTRSDTRADTRNDVRGDTRGEIKNEGAPGPSPRARRGGLTLLT